MSETETHLVGQDVLEHEPDHAVFGGRDGLRIVTTLVGQALPWLRPGGWLVCEIGHGQSEAVVEVVRRCRLSPFGCPQRPGWMGPHRRGTQAGAMSDEFEAASAAVRRGLLVVLPTDTIYGIGALPRSHGGVAGIFEAKGRPMDKPIPVLAANAEDLYDVVVFDERARAVAAALWPGPLSLVLPRQPDWPYDLGGNAGDHRRARDTKRRGTPTTGTDGTAGRHQRESLG